MKKNKIIVQYHYIPIYKFSNFKGNILTKMQIYYKIYNFNLPIYYQLSRSKQIYILNKLKKFFSYK